MAKDTGEEEGCFGAESKTECLSRINVHGTQPDKADGQLPGDVVISSVVREHREPQNADEG